MEDGEEGQEGERKSEEEGERTVNQLRKAQDLKCFLSLRSRDRVFVIFWVPKYNVLKEFPSKPMTVLLISKFRHYRFSLLLQETLISCSQST